MPVPTRGASLRSSGTDWRCMFEPIRARLASSCSRNGIIAVATETICRGETPPFSPSPRPLTEQAGAPERGQPALVGKAGQRVGLVHELGELAGAEELLDGRDHRADVDQGLWRDRLHVLRGHPLAAHPL